MKYIFALTFLIFLANVSRAEQTASVPPIPQPTSPLTLDIYGEISAKEEKERLKSAAEQIKEYQKKFKDASVPFIFYGEKCSALKRVKRAKDYLVKTEGIESNRIYAIYGGDAKDLSISIYLLPVSLLTGAIVDVSKEPDCQAKRKKPRRRIKPPPRRTNRRT